MSSIGQLIKWIEENPGAILSTEALAKKSGLSIRALHRRFIADAGVTPARFVDRTRVRAAQRLITTTNLRLRDIAAACGFRSATVMHRAFRRQLGVTAVEYRRSALKRLHTARPD